MTPLPVLLGLLVGSAVVTSILIIPVRRLGLDWGLVDHPSWRRTQREAVPCSGGLAIYAAIVVAAVALTLTVGLPISLGSLWALGLAGLGTLVLGVLDDRFGVHAEKKLLGQILVVCLPMGSGLTLKTLALPFVGVVDLGVLAGPVTLFWYLGFINSINLIDGLDGLASGIVLFVLGALFLAVAPADPLGVLWVAVLLGSVGGFLRANLSGRRIFLGDAGSMLLGLWLAGLTLGLATSAPQAPAMAVAAMAIPILDTATTILRRWRRGVSIFRADDEHLHHRLLRLGSTPRRAVACLWLATVATGSLGAMILGYPSAGILALGALGAVGIEIAYTLPREGNPPPREALFYLLGLRELPRRREEERPQLAEVIEMRPYRRRRAHVPPATAESTPAEDVVLAVTDEPG